MMRASALPKVLVPVALLLLAATVRADAPAGQYQPFTGLDIDITDNFTGLTWTRATETPLAFTPASLYCQFNVKDENGIGGFRLPTMKELLTLVDEDRHSEHQGGQTILRAIDQNAFPGTVAGPFWTLTRSDSVGAVTPPVDVYAVSFDTGEVVSKPAATTLVFRCVR